MSNAEETSAVPTAIKAEGIVGDKTYQERARRALPILVRQAEAGHPIFYSDLAAELEMPNPRNLNYVLGSVGETLNDLGKQWQEEIPLLNGLVINLQTQSPGDGLWPFLSGGNNWQNLSGKQKRAMLDGFLSKVYSYPKWREILKALGLQPAPVNFTKLIAAAMEFNGGGGESPDHLKLKTYVSQHPSLVGLPASLASGVMEFGLASGDSVDVFFTQGSDQIAVEVKSAISGIHDITRGIFQCVKYQAVLSAMLVAKGKLGSARAILVLEGNLPKELFPLKNMLGVEIIEMVVPK